MVRDAEANAAADKQRRELVEARNHGDALAHSTEKSLSEHADKIPPEVKAQIETDLAALKGVLSSDDVEEIKAKTATLAQSAMKLGEAMYKEQGEAAPQGGPEAGPGSAPGDESVVDADFEEVDNTKK
jgi:molecular chaperone DnaK